ncbi:pilus assembly protein TadG-related protein (plasmid) [Thermanaerothrix sp. 4228-RoL]|uniref:Pilus assembly protein TadG-related protein n=1 Tax=Thermanaerothrix solaris TaxID=3058434 RepID=A0ABU3NRZ7_9CHLR|nr:pilus assembly protein TadG-related protein [Thermanaerothrix sp. 4228-RoL]MDT8899595.1 pilus assembly protein TadG-related protein [Thermanaerothrix sp. 4228-RoL]
MATQVVTNTRFSRYERGQSAVLFAFVMLAMVLFTLFVIDYAVTTARSMETISAADLAAHAGAQDIRVLPNGKIVGSSQGAATAYAYFSRQKPPYASFRSASCGTINGRPGCLVVATTRSPGFFLPPREIEIRAVGYLIYGTTREEQ